MFNEYSFVLQSENIKRRFLDISRFMYRSRGGGGGGKDETDEMKLKTAMVICVKLNSSACNSLLRYHSFSQQNIFYGISIKLLEISYLEAFVLRYY